MATTARAEELPLFGVIDAIRASDLAIHERVAARRAAVAARTGLAGAALVDALADDLIDDARFRSALVGAGAGLPIALPWIGFWGTLFTVVTGAAVWQLAIEAELVFALAAAYGTRLDPEQLRLTAFWLVQLTNYEDLRERALTIGVRVTVRRLVQKLLAAGLTRAFEATASRAAAARLLGCAPWEPWYVAATRYLGVPVLFYFGWRSTTAVGARAKAYFAEEAATCSGSAA